MKIISIFIFFCFKVIQTLLFFNEGDFNVENYNLNLKKHEDNHIYKSFYKNIDDYFQTPPEEKFETMKELKIKALKRKIKSNEYLITRGSSYITFNIFKELEINFHGICRTTHNNKKIYMISIKFMTHYWRNTDLFIQ